MVKRIAINVYVYVFIDDNSFYLFFESYDFDI